MNFAPPTLTRLAAASVFVVAVGFTSRANAEDYVKSYSVTGRADVRVYTDDSSIRVTTSDTNQVEFHVTYEGFAAIQIGGDIKVDSHQNGDQVELTEHVRSGITIGFNNRRISTEVHMPRNADLQLESHDGHIEVSSLNGKITVHTTDGGIKASQLTGTIDIRTNDGSISVDTLAGDIKLHSGDGSVGGTNLDGKCEAESSNGSVHVAGRFDFLDIKSGDGSVAARIAPGSRISSSWNIRTGDGSVEVAIPKDFKVNLDASTKDGRITLGLPVEVQGNIAKSVVQGTVNGGGPSLVIRTGDGSIHLDGA
jgi:DUF4097 and DUF4098 domain-containing protein YvlB